MRANTARHYAEAPEKVISRVIRRKEQDAQAAGHWSVADIDAIRKKLRDRCRYCNSPLNGGGEIEHLTPVSRGGSHWPQNLTLACFKCNKEKHGKTLEEYLFWRQDRGLPIRKLS
jgi:5-methylcytosine-specific restriction endonuclease McrA